MNIEKYLDKNEIFQYALADTSVFTFSEAVVDACRTNQCGRYGSCWTCPPAVGTLPELKTKLLKYSNAAIFTCKYELEDCFDFETMTYGANRTRELLYEIMEDLKKDGVDFMALACGSCSLCEKCTYPDLPCRHPDKALVSVEACGISVVDLAGSVGVNYHNGENTVTYFCVILY